MAAATTAKATFWHAVRHGAGPLPAAFVIGSGMGYLIARHRGLFFRSEHGVPGQVLASRPSPIRLVKKRAAFVRSGTSSFRKIRLTCVFTVASLK